MNIKDLAASIALIASTTYMPTAHSLTVLNDWNLNLSTVNGTTVGATTFSGLGDATGIDHVNISGTSTVEQTISGGVSLGESFTDNGFLQFDSWAKETGGLAPSFGSILNGYGFYLTFSDLTGTLNSDGSITFDPGVGSVKLWLESDFDGIPTTGDVLELASFSVLAPSGGSDLDFFGGEGANATIDVSLGVESMIASLFTDSNDNDLDEMSFALVNTDSLLQSIDTDVDLQGNGISTIVVENGGQYNIAEVPEPASLALLGLGMIGMSGFRKQKRS